MYNIKLMCNNTAAMVGKIIEDVFLKYIQVSVHVKEIDVSILGR